MKKSLLCLFAAAALAVTSCYDDTDLVNRVETLESDVKGLKELVSTLNTNVSGLQSLVSALQENNFITSVTEVKDKATGAVIGYTISFTKGNPIVIYHGEKGSNGNNGNDGKTPVIGVTLVDGVYYWTIDGSILKDSEGNNVPATGPQGEQGTPGTPGTPGNDGVTPSFRITDGYWEMSIDNGETWEKLGPATGDSEVTAVDAVFSDVKETSEGVLFTLVDGSKILVPREKVFAVEIDNSKVYDVVAGSATEIAYTVTGGDDETVVDAFASGSWYAEAVAADATSGCIKVSVPADGGDKGKVLVFAANGKGKTDIKTVSFAKGVVTFVAPTTMVPVDGDNLSIAVTSNVDYTVEVEEDSKSWISVVTTKVGAMRTDNLDVVVSANNTPEQRVGAINLVDAQGATVQTIAITQESGSYTAPAFADDNFKAYILKNFDKDGDGAISSEEAAAIETINYSDDMGGVTSWAGVEAFYNLKNFTFTGSSYYTQKSTFETLDLSNNSKLENLSVLSKTVTSIDLTGLTQVKAIQVGLSSKLAELKFGSLKELTNFVAYATALTSVDLSGCPEITNLALYDTQISTLDLSCCPKLESVSVGTSKLTSLNLNGCTEISSLGINNAKFTEFDFSALTKLTKFNADYTSMTIIDLSNSPLLTSINASSCAKLEIIDASKATKLSSLTAYSNNALREIRIAEGVNASSFFYTTGHWNEDETYTSTQIVVVPTGEEPVSDYIAGIQDEYVKKLILRGYDKNNDGQISAEEAAEIKELDLSEFALTSVDGLSDLPSLEKLNLADNKLTAFNGEDFKALKELDLKNNALTTVALKNNKLTVLDLSNNKLTGDLGYSQLPSSLIKLDVSKNAVKFSPYNFYYLESLDMSYTSATELSGTSSMTKVKYLNVSNTKIAGELKIGSLKALETLDIRNTDITTVDVSGAVTAGTLKSILADGSKLNLVKVGSGNELPEGLVQGVDEVMVQNFTSPTKSLKTNEWGYITEFIAGEGATASDFTVNYTEASSGFVIDAGGQASIKVKSGRKVVKFFALGVNGAPQITLERSSGKVIYTKSTDSSYYGESYKSSDENPFTVAENASATKNQSSFIVDGNGAYHFFNLSAEFSSATSTEEGEEIIFKVSGKEGEKVILLGINMAGSRDDDE